MYNKNSENDTGKLRNKLYKDGLRYWLKDRIIKLKKTELLLVVCLTSPVLSLSNLFQIGSK